MRKHILLVVFSVAVGMAICLSPAFALEKEVVVYSTNLEKLNEMVAEDFEKATGVKVHMYRAGSGIVIKKIKAEKDRPLADVGWGLSKIICENNKDLWQPYKSVNYDVTPAAYDPARSDARSPTAARYDATVVPNSNAPDAVAWSHVAVPATPPGHATGTRRLVASTHVSGAARQRNSRP